MSNLPTIPGNAGTKTQTQNLIDRLNNPNLTEEQYKQIRFEFISANEGTHNAAYVDTAGKKTAGIGFNMDAASARSEWGSVFGNSVNFNDVYNGQVILTNTKVRQLYDSSVSVRDIEQTDTAIAKLILYNPKMTIVQSIWNSTQLNWNLSNLTKWMRKIRFVIWMSFIIIFPIKSYASTTIEDVIKLNKIDISKDSDRCELPFLIENNHVEIFNSKQVEFYNVIIGDYSKNNDSGITFRVRWDKGRHIRVASFYDSDRFYILKLKNGELIGSHNGYFVPFDELEIGSKNHKLGNNFVIMQNVPPRDKIKYFQVDRCKVQIFNNN